MAGMQVPLVLVPRYSSYTGADTFTTLGIDVTDYSRASVCVWRSPLIGSSPTFALTFEESMDQNSWTTCSGTSAGVDPGADTETMYSPTLAKRWFRLKLVLGGTSPVATCWVIGYLEQRES
jgi:hypothetical protein